MLKYFPVFVVFGVQMFFSVSSILGYEYQGRDSSPIYIVYNLILFSLSMVFILFKMFLKNIKYNKSQIILLSIPVLFVFIYLLSMLFYLTNESGTTRFYYFILWSFPAIYMGVYLAKNNLIDRISKFMEVLMLVLSIGTLLITLEALSSGFRVSIGGATYQYAAYVAAFSFGLNLYFLFYGQYHERFNFSKTKLYRVFCYFLLFIQLIGTLSAGGRGAPILLIIYFLYIIFSIIKNPKKIVRFLGMLIGAMLVLILISPILVNIELFVRSISRVFAYITPDGLNWDETSGRNIVYSSALELIFQSPVWGYGIFGMYKAFGEYPHNFFLELFLQGGLLYFSLWIIVFFFMSRKIYKSIKYNPEFRIIVIIFLYPFTLLMFSGTYLNDSVFWFSLSFIMSYSVKK